MTVSVDVTSRADLSVTGFEVTILPMRWTSASGASPSALANSGEHGNLFGSYSYLKGRTALMNVAPPRWFHMNRLDLVLPFSLGGNLPDTSFNRTWPGSNSDAPALRA
jgi:hypothetical protein